MTTTALKITRAGLFAGVLLAGAFALTAAEFENNLNKSFPVSPGGKLVVDADRGAIDVSTGDSDKVEVQVFRKVRGLNQSRAEEMFKAHEITFEQQAGQVTVTAKFHGAAGGLFNRGGSGLQVRYQISIPKKFNVDLKTSGGAITQADLTGTVLAQTSGGSLKLAKIDGSVWGKTSGGSISLASASGEVDVHTSGGGIQVGEAGAGVLARTSGGSVRLDKAKGAVVAETSGGNIDIGEAAGSAEAKTSGGSISANLTGQPKGECHLETSGGSIRLNCAESVAVDLDAKTSGGRVVSELPVTVVGEHKSSELHGKINGGGPLLSLRTSGGSIFLKKM